MAAVAACAPPTASSVQVPLSCVFVGTDYSSAFSEVGNSVLTDCTSATPVAVATVDVLD